jgi:hypothetical protein
VVDDSRFLQSLVPSRDLEPRAGNAGSSAPEEPKLKPDFERVLDNSKVYRKASGGENVQAMGEGMGEGVGRGVEGRRRRSRRILRSGGTRLN